MTGSLTRTCGHWVNAASQDTNIENWLKESYDAARKFVYDEKILEDDIRARGRTSRGGYAMKTEQRKFL